MSSRATDSLWALASIGVFAFGCAGSDSTPPALLFTAECAPLEASRSPESSCSREGDCPAGVCGRDPAVAAEDGTATVLSCLPGAGGGPTGAACEDGPECETRLCTLSGRCVVPYHGNLDCPAEERCQQLFVRTGAALERTAGCVPEVVAWPEVTVTRESPFPLERQAGGGYQAELPLSAAGLSAITGTCSAGELFPERLADPGMPATVYFDRSLELALLPITVLSRPLTVWFPETVQVVPASSSPLLTVSAAGPGNLTKTHFLRSGSAGGTLDIDIYYVGGGDLVPEGALGPPRVAGWVTGLMARFTNVELGAVRQHNVTGELRQRLSRVDREPLGFPELAELGGLTAGEQTPSFSVMLVRTIQGLEAFSGGLPAASAMPGLAGSSLVLAVDGRDDETLERTLAHELGHFLGLFHTTEAGGGGVEPLDDTPRCPLSQDSDDDKVLSALECSGFDGSNLMFWAAAGDTLSPKQLRVVGESPLLRPR